MSKKKKVRVDLRKNRAKPPRQKDFTRGYQEHGFADEATVGQERVRTKGDLSRRRTIIQDATGATPGVTDPAAAAMPAVDPTVSRPGRVLRVHGLWSVVEDEDGRHYRCAVRRLLKTLVTDERSIVTTGDRVWFRPANPLDPATVTSAEQVPEAMPEGWIERVEPRHGVLTRASRR